jgi:hypothetical protein
VVGAYDFAGALRRRAELEVDVLALHAMHDDGELSRDGHAGLLSARRVGQEDVDPQVDGLRCTLQASPEAGKWIEVDG